MGKDLRTGFVVGYQQAWRFLAPGETGNTEEIFEGVTKLAERATVGETVNGITAICSEPENGGLMIGQATMLFAMKVAGASEEGVRKLAAIFRESNTLPPTSESFPSVPAPPVPAPPKRDQ